MARSRKLELGAIAVGVMVLQAFAAAAGELHEGLASAYQALDLSPPTRHGLIVCHGFGCKFRSSVGLTAADHRALAAILQSGRASADAERQAVARAALWFDRRIGPVTGTVNHVARANWRYSGDPHQFDCIDTSRNTTSLLLVIDELGLLRHHVVREPHARGRGFDGRPPHATAVLSERISGRRWSVDSWTRAYGQAPEIMPLDRWVELD
jgi:hypothetical protein